MKDIEQVRPLALVVTDAADKRECSCRALEERGYDPVGFSDYENASAWIEEETPVVAVLSAGKRAECEALLYMLQERGLEIEAATTIDGGATYLRSI